MNRITRFFLFSSLAVTAATVAPTAHAIGGAFAPSSGGDPSTLDIQVAVTKVAGSPPSATRWSRITVSGIASVMWLVPVRPGAAVDYSNDAWLDALDETTAPRVAPRDPGTCSVKQEVERVDTWGSVGAKKYPKAVTVLDTEADARAHIAALDYRVSVEAGGRIHDAYTKGWSFVALEIVTPTSGIAVASSPTVRVRDDGGLLPGGAQGFVPLALTGSTAAIARVTAWVIGDGAAELPGTRDLDDDSIVWSSQGSTFAKDRASLLGTSGGTWVRESVTRDGFFTELLLPKTSPLPPLYAAYFAAASGGPRTGCEASALTASSAMGVVRRVCGAGAVANVTGGAPCAPGSGAIDPAAFTCGAGVDDLALALANVSPSNVTATRFSGVVGKATFGTDVAIGSANVTVPTLHKPGRTECKDPTGTSSSGSSSSSGGPTGGPSLGTPVSSGGGGSSSHTGQAYWWRNESCSGSTVIYVDQSGGQHPVSDEGCGGSSEIPSSGGGSSSSSGGSSSGWDVDDNSSVSGGGSSSSSSSSSSDDGCGGDSGKTSSSDDGCGGDSGSSSSSDSCDCGGSGSSSSSSSGCDSSSSSSSDSCKGSSGSDSCSCSKGAGASNGPGMDGRSGERLFPKGRMASNGRVKASSGGRSPVSRYALFFVALALPLRRRLRNAKWKW